MTTYLVNSSTWENKNLGDFLQAISRYAKDIHGYYDTMQEPINADQANWQVFADIFKGSSTYE